MPRSSPGRSAELVANYDGSLWRWLFRAHSMSQVRRAMHQVSGLSGAPNVCFLYGKASRFVSGREENRFPGTRLRSFARRCRQAREANLLAVAHLEMWQRLGTGRTPASMDHSCPFAERIHMCITALGHLDWPHPDTSWQSALNYSAIQCLLTLARQFVRGGRRAAGSVSTFKQVVISTLQQGLHHGRRATGITGPGNPGALAGTRREGVPVPVAQLVVLRRAIGMSVSPVSL